MILQAVPEDHAALSILTKKSKAYWGYNAAQMAEWDAQLTITPDYISENIVYKLVLEEKLTGYYSFLSSDNETITLDNLFIAPEFMGKGYGKILLDDAIEKARNVGFKTITLEADPNAEVFYSRFGFVTTGQAETSIPGRFLPIMELAI